MQNVFLAISDPEQMSTADSLLTETADLRAGGSCSSTVDLFDAVERADSDVVLLDAGIGPLPALDVVRALVAARPWVSVLLITRDPSASLLAHSLDAGVRGVLASPLSLEELQARIPAAAEWSGRVRTAGERAEGHTSGRIIAVTGAKGGVGTTTIAVHLARAALAPGREVCLVDFDLQAGDVPNFLDLSHRRSITDLVDVAEELSGRNLVDALYLHESGLRVLLAPSEGERADEVTEHATKQVLGALRSRFDTLVIDVGAYLTDASAAIIEAADEVLLVVTPDSPALRGAKRTLRMWDRLAIRKEADVSIVVNRASSKREIQPAVVGRVVDSPVVGVVPAAFGALEAAVNTGDPGLVDDPAVRKAIDGVAKGLGIAAPRRPAGSSRRWWPERGAAAVEMMGLLPLVLFVVAAVFQLALVGYTKVNADRAAAEAARTLSQQYGTGPEAQAQARSAGSDELSGAWREGAAFSFTRTDGSSQATVTVDVPLLLPGVLTLPLSITSTAEAQS